MPIRVDVTQGMATAGFLKEVSVKIGTPQYVGPVLKWVHQKMSEAFSEHMATLAPHNQAEFHHVYEWDQIGDPSAQLWRDVLVGGGATRMATWEWLASKTVVPVVHPEAIGKVKQIHIFTWKAPVMEYDTEITIAPKRGEWLAYFTGPPGDNTSEELRFTKEPITVQNPGGPATKGAFTKEYVSWWGGEGSATEFRMRIQRLLEHDLAGMPLNSVSGAFRAGTRSRNKPIGIVSIADATAAEEAGRRAARLWLEKRNKNYIAGAISREAISGGLSD